MARSKNLSPNMGAFLDAIAWAEGTSTSAITRDDGYDIIVSGVDGAERFDDYSRHPFSQGRPSKKINHSGLTSNASGRYQFMLKDYLHYRNALGLKDFGPYSQDVWAIQLIRERRAIDAVERGNIKAAVGLVRNLWASLPGAGYGQQERSIERFIEVYLSKGGKLWDSDLKFTHGSPAPLPLSVESSESTLKANPLPQPKPEPERMNVWQKLLAMLLRRKS